MLVFLSELILIYILIFFFIRRFYIMGPSKGEKIDFTQREKELLLVIDIQNSYIKMTPRKLAHWFISNINKVLGYTYELNYHVVYTASVRKKTFFSSLFLFDIAIQGAEGAKIFQGLNIKNLVVFEKYLADSFYEKDFCTYLANNKIKKIFICGMAAEICVGETIKGALKRGYEVVVIKDAIISMFGKRSLERILNEVKNLGAQVISVEDYLKS
jgi:nicotinamidase-related amidase